MDVKIDNLHMMTNRGNFGKKIELQSRAKAALPTLAQADWFRISDAAALGIFINLFHDNTDALGVEVSCLLTCCCVYIIQLGEDRPSFPLILFVISRSCHRCMLPTPT